MANTHSIDLELSSSQYLSITDANQTGLDRTGDTTIEAWVKFESLPGVGATQMKIASKYNTASDQRGYDFNLWYIGAGDFRLNAVYSTDGTYQAANDVFVDFVPTVGTWYHLAVVYDIGNTDVLFYVNGSQQGTTQSTTGGSIYNNNAAFNIGALSGTTFFDGKIDDVRVWSDIRTATEIANYKDVELNGDETNLVGYWKLNNSLLDETSNDNDLTNNNSAVFSTDVPFSGATAVGVKNFLTMGVGK